MSIEYLAVGASLVAALLGVGGTLAGVWIAQRGAARQAEADRRERLQAEVRRGLSELIFCGRDWIASWWMLGHLEFSTTAGTQLKIMRDVVVGLSERGQVSLERVPRLLGELLITVADGDLRDLLDQVRRFHDRPEIVSLGISLPIQLASGAAQPATKDQLVAAAREYGELLEKLEVRSAAMLSGKI